MTAKLPGHPAPHDLPTHVSASYGVQAWERQTNESEQDWDLFVRYRESAYPDGYGATFRPRRLQELSAATGHSLGLLKGRAGSHAWEERVGAFDRMIDARKTAAGATFIERVQFQHQRILDKSRIVIEQTIEDLLAKANAGDHLSAREGIALAELTFKYDRLLSGQSTENISVKHDWDLELMPPEDIRTLQEIYQRNKLAIAQAGR